VATLHQVLGLVQVLVFTALGLVAVGQWRRRRGASAAWLAATFGVLATVVLVGQLLPDQTVSPTMLWARRLTVAFVVLFPYLLYRFMSSFLSPIPWVHAIAVGLTGAAVAGAVLLPPIPESSAPRPETVQLYIYVVLLQWGSLSALIGYRFWHEGRGQPTVCRRRMRTLSLGSVGLAVALVVAGAAPSMERISATQLLVDLFAIASGLLFFMGFAPPAFVRRAWRRPEEDGFKQAELALMEAENARCVGAVVVPHLRSLMGGRGAVLVGDGGTVIEAHGLDTPAARELAEWVSSQGPTSVPGGPFYHLSRLGASMRSGWLAVEASVYTPFFGREEMEMMHRLALLTELALARADLLQRERQSNAQLVEAQRVAHMGSWEWDMVGNHITWSEELYRIFGLDPREDEPSLESFFALVHPDDRSSMEAMGAEVDTDHEPFTHQYRIIRPTGETIVVQASGKVIVDDAGQATKMIGTAQDITERKEQESYREQFIANAAHELRTPLTSLLGLTELLSHSRHRMTEERVAMAFEAAVRSGQRLSVLVDNLLDLSKLQQGAVEISPEPVSVGLVSKRLLESASVPDGTSVMLEVDEDAVALADPVRLDQVLQNLFTNAFRYGGPEIVLEGRSAGRDVVISVSDNGPGVEKELIPHLFDPFARGSGSSEVGGSGLGLAIVRMLVDASGGEIRYENGRAGGARFCIRLPRAP
jgi:PAS domain S-box-containing protein